MNFYTTDISASVHKAYADFTHVVLNRSGTLPNPQVFDSRPLMDLPLYQYASWIPGSDKQLERWESKGGVLVVQDTHKGVDCDVVVLTECPYNMSRLVSVVRKAKEYYVVPNPVSWAGHDECVDLRFPVPELMREIWRICRGKQMTTHELAKETGVPHKHLSYLKTSLEPKEYWYIQKRLAPEREEFIPPWDWIESGAIPRSEITNKGFRPAIEEMARFGYIGLKKLQHFPDEEPDWKQMQKNREEALKDLVSVRVLLESLPDHLAE